LDEKPFGRFLKEKRATYAMNVFSYIVIIKP
jgi:hypothetical protein